MSNPKRIYKLHNYSDENVQKALKSIEDGMSLRKAAEQFNVPKSTLHAKVTELVPENCTRGPSTTLSIEEEIRIKKWILDKAALGFPMHPEEVKDAVQRVLKDAPRKNKFTDDRPGNKWLKLYLRRHPEITKRNAEVISKGRASVTEAKLRDWFKHLKLHLEETNNIDVLTKPRSIFNGDETGMQLAPKGGRLLGKKGDKNFYEIASGKEKETITVLCTFSAAGEALAPMILYPYTRIPSHIIESVPDNWPIGRSGTGWMISSTFYEYIANTFYPWCVRNNVEFPVIYFLDGHQSHLTLELSDFCVKNRIIMYSLYPNSTHITQPCDVAIFRALKYKWKQVVQNHKQKTQKSITKSNFAPLFKEAFEQLTEETIKNSFEACGLYPFDENSVNYDRCISTRRENIRSDGNNDSTITHDDLLSTQKFLYHFLGNEQLAEFQAIKNENRVCSNPVYKLWETCVDNLAANSINISTTAVVSMSTSVEENTMEIDIESVPSVNNDKVNSTLNTVVNGSSNTGCNGNNFDEFFDIENIPFMDINENISIIDVTENISIIRDERESLMINNNNNNINSYCLNHVNNVGQSSQSITSQINTDIVNIIEKDLNGLNITTSDKMNANKCNPDVSNIINIGDFELVQEKEKTDKGSPNVPKIIDVNNFKAVEKIENCINIHNENNINDVLESNIKCKIENPFNKQSRNFMNDSKTTISDVWNKHLSWPETGEIKFTKKKDKISLPYAITAEKWREFHQKVKEEKDRKELEAKDKKIKRELIKQEKEQELQKKKFETEQKKIEMMKIKEEKFQIKKEKDEKRQKIKEEKLKIKQEKAQEKKRKIQFPEKPSTVKKKKINIQLDKNADTPIDLTINKK